MGKLKTAKAFRLYITTGVLTRETTLSDSNVERLIDKAYGLNAERKAWDRAIIYDIDGKEVWRSDGARQANDGQADAADAAAADD
jgi:hypothetical protein